jgi:hypothetical protein
MVETSLPGASTRTAMGRTRPPPIEYPAVADVKSLFAARATKDAT